MLKARFLEACAREYGCGFANRVVKDYDWMFLEAAAAVLANPDASAYSNFMDLLDGDFGMEPWGLEKPNFSGHVHYGSSKDGNEVIMSYGSGCAYVYFVGEGVSVQVK